MAMKHNRGFQRKKDVDVHFDAKEFLPLVRSRSNVSFLKQANRVADESSGFKVDEADGDAKSLYPKRSGVEINFRKRFVW